MDEVVNAIVYVARTGCQWTMLPKDFPPKGTIEEYFYAWRADGTLETVKRSDDVTRSKVLPRRWVVERASAWLGRNRRLARDFEATIASAEAGLMIATIQLLARRLARL